MDQVKLVLLGNVIAIRWVKLKKETQTTKSLELDY